jgi:hypothetical protein
MRTSLGQSGDDAVPDCNEQISGYDYWGDGILRSPELSARFWSCISSSPAIMTTPVDRLDFDGIEIEPIPAELEKEQTVKNFGVGSGNGGDRISLLKSKNDCSIG